MLVHVVTKKGKGYPPAEAAADKYHGVTAFDVITGAQAKPKSNAPAYTRVFANALVEEARRDAKIVGITAAMPDGTGLDQMKAVFPERVFDVGIAEQHAVTCRWVGDGRLQAFPLSIQAFLQRGYDGSCTMWRLEPACPLRPRPRRAGWRGRRNARRGLRHRLSRCLPNMTVMAASDEAELVHMVAPPRPPIPARSPCAIRVARASASTCRSRERFCQSARAGARSTRVAILSLGNAARRSPEGG